MISSLPKRSRADVCLLRCTARQSAMLSQVQQSDFFLDLVLDFRVREQSKFECLIQLFDRDGKTSFAAVIRPCRVSAQTKKDVCGGTNFIAVICDVQRECQFNLFGQLCAFEERLVPVTRWIVGPWFRSPVSHTSKIAQFASATHERSPSNQRSGLRSQHRFR